MDLELRISQYIDGELSGEEEAELHHMLAVSPEARALFRQHLTIHTVARDERVLHRPEQSMRDSLFARLQAEEGMKPSAVLLASAGAEAATLSAVEFPSEGRVAQDRPPIASEADSRTEERRRRRRLIPILIPLLLCVIVGGVWYGGGFGGNGGSGGVRIAENQGAKQRPSATSDHDYTEQTEASTTNSAYDSLTQPHASASSSVPHVADAFEPEGHFASSESHPESFGSAPEPAPEMYALRSVPADEVNNVLGIASTAVADVDDMEMEKAAFDPAETNNMAQADASADLSASAPAFAMQSLAYETLKEGALWNQNADFVPPLQDSMAITLVPERATMSAAFSPNRDQSVVNGGAGNVRSNGIDVSDRFSASSAMSNSIPLSNTVAKPVLGGRLYDTATGRPVIPTIDNYEQFAAMLEEQGLKADSGWNGGLEQSIALNDGTVNVNTGSRSMNGAFDVNAFVPLNADGSAREKGEGAVPVVLSSTFAPTYSSPLTALGGNSDSLNLAVLESHKAEENQMNKSLIGGAQATKSVPANAKAVAQEHSVTESVSADVHAVVEDVPLEPSRPRGVNFFIGLDQSLGASVSSMEVALPLPASSFSSFTDNGLSPETRIMFGIDFDGGRQKVFVTAGAWGYNQRESIRSRETTHVTTGNSVVNTVTTTVSEKEQRAYEVWGGAGYRYSVNVSRKLDAGAEVWGGVGSEYLHAGLSVPISYQLVENLQFEVSPGLLYRSLHTTAEQVTTGAPVSDSYEERIITPKDEHRLEAAVRIGLILLLR